MYRVFDMFSGGGGMHLGVERAGFNVVAYCEIDKYAKAFYENAFNPSKEVYFNNAVEIDTGNIPEFELLCAGFPCQTLAEIIERIKNDIYKKFKNI